MGGLGWAGLGFTPWLGLVGRAAAVKYVKRWQVCRRPLPPAPPPHTLHTSPPLRPQDRLFPHCDFDTFITQLERLSGTMVVRNHMNDQRVRLLKVGACRVSRCSALL